VGNLLSVTDTKGNVSTMTYDSLSRKLTMHDPDMGNWSYTYDANGNLKTQIDAKSQKLCFDYDALNRRTQKNYGTTTVACGTNTVVYSYDDTVAANNGKGRLKQVTDPAQSVTFQYDSRGRIKQSAKTLDGTTYTTTSAYDGLGRLTSVNYPTNPIKTVTYTYDGPQLKSVLEGATTYVTYAGWNALGQSATATFGNGVVTTSTYANTSNTACPQQTFRLCTLKTQKGVNPLYQDLRYDYEANGNVWNIYDATVASSAGDQHFSYDDLDRLTLANGPYGVSGANASFTYTYNEIGNLTLNSQLSATAYTYPTSGASSVRPHAVSTAGAYSYTYDANGNMLTGAGRTYTWNSENKPLTIVQGGTTTTFVYDGDGGRVKKNDGSTITRYIGKLYECDNANCTRFIWAEGARIATIPSSGAINYWHGDHLGSSSVITDSTGAKVEALTYYPYGATRTNLPGTPVNVPYKYTGQELDASTGLYDYGARLYDPMLGRFIGADSIVPDHDNPQDLNRYTYAGNNPFRYIDPSGHDHLPCQNCPPLIPIRATFTLPFTYLTMTDWNRSSVLDRGDIAVLLVSGNISLALYNALSSLYYQDTLWVQGIEPYLDLVSLQRDRLAEYRLLVQVNSSPPPPPSGGGSGGGGTTPGAIPPKKPTPVPALNIDQSYSPIQVAGGPRVEQRDPIGSRTGDGFGHAFDQMNENLELPLRLRVFQHNVDALQHYQLNHQKLMQSIYSHGGVMFQDSKGRISGFGEAGLYFTSPDTRTTVIPPTR
jgi:RHS repeat-associated protein